MNLDTDIVTTLDRRRQRIINRLLIERARLEWSSDHGKELAYVPGRCDGLIHWCVTEYLNTSGDFVACGQDDVNIPRHLDPTLKLTCPKCRKLLEIVGGEEALAILGKPAEPTEEPIVAEAHLPRGGFF